MTFSSTLSSQFPPKRNVSSNFITSIGGSNRLFLIALFLLSAIGFVTTIYTSFFSSTVRAVTRSESERQLIAVDIVFSFIQLVFTYIQLIRVFLGAKNNNNNESLLPLAFAVISVVFIFRNNEEAQVVSDSASVSQFILLETPAVDDESAINRESSTLRQRTTSTQSEDSSRGRWTNHNELIDPISKRRVTSGPYSSIKIHILVLNGDFGFEDQGNWTEREFSAKVVRERVGRKPLVTGELNITFKDGVGIISDISFTDNSSWIESRKFRLGARVLKSIGGQVRIKDARSEAFVVKDHRGELYTKHHPPLLEDEVWRLEKIAKDGKYHTKLTSHNIRSIKDFLRLYVIDPNSLKRMLDCSNRVWDIIVKHASTCALNDEIFYTYSVEGIGLLFNSVYKLVAATFDGQNYQFLDDPTFTHKPLVETIKKQVYRNVNSFVQHPEFPVAHAGSSEIQSGFDHASPSTSYNYGPEDHSQQSHFSVAENTQPIQAFDPMCSRNYSFKWTDLFPPKNGKTKAAWCKIRAVLKWRSVKRMAAKKMARPFYVNSI
ncbi:hypothetical protein EZV62_006535 [Acer yangbiense]|uniref:Uncharacterized protein n=1 Tax=Acer yangbiense TaxID=1000413 RepID=A0A5C7I7G1_9ROSI|nr:hypothetical protein EZV62_006535 [Acer yangbiense]